MEINITVRDKIASGDGTWIVCGNSDYTVRFALDSEWDQFKTRTMIVVNADKSYQEVVFTGDTAALPVISNQKAVSIGLYAGDLHTTTSAYFNCKKSARDGLGEHEAPSEDIYNQLVLLVENGAVKGEKGDKGEPGQDAPQEAVLYTAQTLSDAQKAQARENIDAASEADVNALKNDLNRHEKILFDSSDNLYDPALQTDATIAKHYYVNGKPYSSTQFDSAYNATAFIPIKPNKQYTVGLIPAAGGFSLPWANAMQGMFFYREADDESYISTQKNQTFTTPGNAKYMRFTFAIVSGITLSVVNSRLVLVEGDTLPESYIPFYSKTLSDVVSENTSKIAGISNGMQSVLMSAESVAIRSRYSDAEDLIIKIGRHGGNNLIDFQQVGFINRYAAGYSIDRMIIETASDFFSPHQIYADSNADGDHPDKTYFTGGSHTSDNSSGGGATATNVRFDVYADGQSLSAGDTCIADTVVISWRNLVNGYNTSKDDGTGRNILQEDIRLTIKGGKVTANVTHTALEALHRITYYGLQQRLTGFSTIRFVGGSNRAVIQTSANANSGSKNCRDVVMESSVGDCCRVHIDQTDIGDFDGNKAYPHSAFTSYGKSYFTLFAGANFAMLAGDQTMMEGYYQFYRS